MKIESKKMIFGLFLFVFSLTVFSSSAFAQGYTIVPNSNNQAFFGSSTYAKNYYRNLGYYTVETNPAAACYGLNSCYSVNYYYPKVGYYYNNNSYNNGYNNSYGNVSYDNYNYTNYNYGYNNGTYLTNNYSNNYNNYQYQNQYQSSVNVYSVPQVYWSR